MRASDKAYEALREDILRWRLAPGTVLGESEQSARLGISRTPLREAITRLAAEGLVDTAHGRAGVVTAVSPDNLVELFELREALETQASRLAARRRGPHVFEQLLSDFDDASERLGRQAAAVFGDGLAADSLAGDSLADAGLADAGLADAAPAYAAPADTANADAGHDDYYALVARLDAAIDDAVANSYLLNALRSLRAHLERARRLAHDNPKRLAESAAEHRLIVQAIVDSDETLAAQATAVHLKKSLDNLLHSVRRNGASIGASAGSTIARRRTKGTR
ncbi:GntR family transcriptional regulator [Rathayibacter soli]|uniref:GntR family transcriptional regulator n=1 Tax=Rathayibacter soli TaxID=3144168 RepID=UPI0027E3ED78|nr:GntR family transcriptional regulator [Glaciibacter superstes]